MRVEGDTSSIGRVEAGPVRPLYETVFSFLREQIVAGRLPQGGVLQEGPLASFFKVSRAPVRRALEKLHEERLIEPRDGRGYSIRSGRTGRRGPGRGEVEIRLDSEALRGLFGELDTAEFDRSTAWERIYAAAEAEIAACLPFGTYRILESSLGDYFSVSRTVVREVLSRLRDRRLVEKDRRSHWVAGPLTARMVSENYEIRRLLEPRALVSVADSLEPAAIEAMLQRVIALERDFESADSETIERIDEDLHVTCLLGLKNRTMLSVISDNQLPFIVNQAFRRHLGLHVDESIPREHRLVFEQLALGAKAAAGAALEAHLLASERRTIAQLKVLSVFPEPEIAPYLLRIH